MSKRKKIGIIGLGMIGGSLALALKGDYDVLGYDVDGTVRKLASDGYCAVVEPNEMRDCAVVFVCVPIHAMQGVLTELRFVLGDGVIISDVASVKAPFSATGRYVGGHPMAGTERGGIIAAKPHLFQNAYWVLTSKGADADVVKSVVESTGAIPIFMTAEEHDRAVAMFSHAPHAVAYALTEAACGEASPIAGSGFLDTTRIAASDGGFWTNVFSLNAENVSRGIKRIISELTKIDGMIERGETTALRAHLDGIRIKREALNRVDLGGEALYVDLVDRVGEFERVTGTIARGGINVKNIALVPGRDGASGALRLEFESAEDKKKAEDLLGGVK